MSNALDVLKQRRSVRKYSDRPVAREDLDRIIEAGLYAPSGMGRQSVKILAITNTKLRDQLSELNREIGGWDARFDPFYGAQTVLAVISDKESPTCVYDGALVIGNLLNAAEALGISGCWIHRAKETFEHKIGKQILKDLNIEGKWEGIGFCILGYGEGGHQVAAERKENRIFYIE